MPYVMAELMAGRPRVSLTRIFFSLFSCFYDKHSMKITACRNYSMRRDKDDTMDRDG